MKIMEKSEGKVLEEKLFNQKKSGWETATDEEKGLIFKFSDEYMAFLNKAKTEREFVSQAKEVLDSNGFKDLCKMDSIKARR